MSVTVILPRRVLPDPIALDACATVFEAIEGIERKCPTGFELLFEKAHGRASPRAFIVTFLDGEMITDLNTHPAPGSELMFATAFSGG
jgi:hypothetical protein